MDRFDGWREVVARLTPSQFKRWDLAPLEQVDPTLLIRDQQDVLGRLFLTLAAAFNDLKGLIIFEGYILDYGHPDRTRPTPELAQWRGLQTQVQRFIAGVLFELMVVLTDRRTREALAGAELRAVVDLVGDETREQWDSLISAAPTHVPRSNVRRSLFYQLRNCVAFHYDQVSLARAYLEAFAEPAGIGPNSPNRRALFSYGPDMDGTRYHYADAATQRLYLGMADGRTNAPSTDAAVIEVAIQVNDALGPMICAFIRHRIERAG